MRSDSVLLSGNILGSLVNLQQRRAHAEKPDEVTPPIGFSASSRES
jgi:hypothetical protein